MSIEELESIAQAMVAPGKGIIAIDESTATIKKRFDSVGVPNTEENRRAYREMLLTPPKLGDHISGAILYDETIRQATKSGVPFTRLMMHAGILPGIKVDMGAKPLAGFPGELVTEGLDGLRERLAEYARLGAKFAKWRAVITIGEDTPSGTCIEANSHALARYAALCQEAGIVPMVEPEVLMDGNHDLEVSYDFSKIFRLTLGAENLLDKFPDRQIASTAATVAAGTNGADNNGIFPYAYIAPYGTSGRFLYVKAAVRF